MDLLFSACFGFCTWLQIGCRMSNLSVSQAAVTGNAVLWITPSSRLETIHFTQILHLWWRCSRKYFRLLLATLKKPQNSRKLQSTVTMLPPLQWPHHPPRAKRVQRAWLKARTQSFWSTWPMLWRLRLLPEKVMFREERSMLETTPLLCLEARHSRWAAQHHQWSRDNHLLWEQVVTSRAPRVARRFSTSQDPPFHTTHHRDSRVQVAM